MSGNQSSVNVLPPLLNGAGLPAKNRIAVVATSVASAVTDLSTLLSDVDKGHFFSVQADGADIYFAMNNANSGSVAAATTGNGATACGLVKNGEVKRFRIIKGYHFLVAVAASGTPNLRIWLSGFTDQDQVA